MKDTENNLIGSLLNSSNIELDFNVLVINMILTALLSLIVRYYYVIWGQSLTNRSTFSSNFVIVAMTTMLVISIVKSSLALSLGLVGALSIVRFRTAIKDPEELGFLFLNISIGLGMGANQREATLVGVAVVLLGIAFNNWIFKWKQKSSIENFYITVLDSNGSSDGDLEKKITGLIEQNANKLRLKKIEYRNSSEGDGKYLEICYMAYFKNIEQLRITIDSIKAISSSLSISYLEVE